MKKFNNFALLVIITISILSVTGCAKKNKKAIEPAQEENIQDIEIKKNHTWYYFTNQSYKQIDKVEKVLPDNLPDS